MKVVALNSSPRTGDVSKTEIMLDCLVEGMRDAGADVEVINLRKKNIKYCTGCFTCWTKTPGKCVIKDDMTKEIFPKFMDCDLCILASPLYHYTFNAQMKTFIERTLPFVQPFFVEKDGVTRHPIRKDPPPVAIISVAGFPEAGVFEPLKSYARYLYGDKLVAEIYRPSSEMLKKPPVTNADISDILTATVEGGRELASSLTISPETLTRINQPFTDFNEMAPVGNITWQTCIDEHITLGEFQKQQKVPRPDSIDTFMTVMKMGFNPNNADALRMVLQFEFSGQVSDNCYFVIENNSLVCFTGKTQNPDLTIRAPFEVWMDILTGKADAAKLLVDEKYTIEGNTDLIFQLPVLFGD